MPQLLALTILTLLFVYWVVDYESSDSVYGKLNIHHDEWVLQRVDRIYKPMFSFVKKQQSGYLVICAPKPYEEFTYPTKRKFIVANDAQTAIRIMIATGSVKRFNA